MFENPRRGRQARNFTTNAPKILDLKSSSEQIFSRKLPLGAPVNSGVLVFVMSKTKTPLKNQSVIYIWSRITTVQKLGAVKQPKTIIRVLTIRVFQEFAECVYLSANRFSIAWENGIQMPFTFFVFAWHWKTDLNFAFCFSFSPNFEKRIWTSYFVFRFRITLKNRYEFRLSLWPRGEENSLAFTCIKSECPGQPRGCVRGLQLTGLVQRSVFQVMQKRQTKFRSAFQ